VTVPPLVNRRHWIGGRGKVTVTARKPPTASFPSAGVLLKLEIRCACGQLYFADPAHAGQAIRCRCGRILPIPAGSKPPVTAPRPRRRIRLPRLHFRPLPVSPRIARLLAPIAWGYLAVTLAYAALLWLGGDAWWLASVLLFIPRWPLLIPALLLLIVLGLTRPRLLLPVVLAVLVALGPGMGYRLGWRGWLAGGTPRAVRIITFNVRGGENPQLLAIPQGLEGYQADILVFQECAEGLLDPTYWPAGWTLRFEQGLCLASRFPVLQARSLERVLTGEQGGTGNAVFYRLAASAGTIDLGIVHLETPRKGLEPLRYGNQVGAMERNVLVREVGSRRLSRWLRQQSDSVIIAGDFNMPVESSIYRTYWGSCRNAFSTVGHGFGWTRFLPHFSIRIDHVLSCSGWRPLRALVGPDLGSDHLPLIVDLARKD
jgi:vancomycin resistance protein VanJ